jgi:hypothetical protein
METTVTVPQVNTVTDANKELVGKVDELGKLGEDVVAAKKLIAAYDKLRKEVVSLAEVHTAPEDATTLVGLEYIAKLTAKTNRRDVIDKQAIFEALGNDTFVELASFRLTDLDKYMTPPQLEKALATVAAGPRKLVTAKRDA